MAHHYRTTSHGGTLLPAPPSLLPARPAPAVTVLTGGCLEEGSQPLIDIDPLNTAPCCLPHPAVKVLMMSIYAAHRDWVPDSARPQGQLEAVQVRGGALTAAAVWGSVVGQC
jgi:hypothetical protein